MRHVSATEARVHLGELLSAVADHGETIAIEQRGKVTAVLGPPPDAAKREPAAPADAWQAWWQLSATASTAHNYRAILEESYER